jgi:hypothetical protein
MMSGDCAVCSVTKADIDASAKYLPDWCTDGKMTQERYVRRSGLLVMFQNYTPAEFDAILRRCVTRGCRDLAITAPGRCRACVLAMTCGGSEVTAWERARRMNAPLPNSG